MIRKWSEADFITAVKESKSIAQVLQKLNLRAVGGNYKTVKFYIQNLKLDASHFHGQAWNRDQQLKTIGAYRSTSATKRALIMQRGHACECCRNTEWFTKPIPLEVDHINGNNKDNRDENLRLLCPNCHAQTPTWRRKK